MSPATTVIERKWHTVAEAAAMPGFGLSKTKMLYSRGRSVPSRSAATAASCLPGWTSTSRPSPRAVKGGRHERQAGQRRGLHLPIRPRMRCVPRSRTR